jgi:hypothetical protein
MLVRREGIAEIVDLLGLDVSATAAKWEQEWWNGLGNGNINSNSNCGSNFTTRTNAGGHGGPCISMFFLNILYFIFCYQLLPTTSTSMPTRTGNRNRNRNKTRGTEHQWEREQECQWDNGNGNANANAT